MSRSGRVWQEGRRKGERALRGVPWYFVLDVSPPGARNRRQIKRRGFATETAARDALDEAREHLRHGTFVDPTKLTARAYLEDVWLPGLRLRPTTTDTYRRLVRVHIVPRLGDDLVQQLDRARVKRWHRELLAAGLSAKSVRNVHGVLSKALTDAVEDKIVKVNVVTGMALPEIDQRPPRAWSPTQLQAFLDATTGERLGPLWRFIAATGCRRGEALGLSWPNVDLDAGTVAIVRQRTIAGGTVVEGATKTKAGARTVALDVGTIAVLKAWRATQNAERLIMGAGWPKTDLVFTHPDGTGLWPQTVTASFKTKATELELPTIGVHGLRHSAATTMIAGGINPVVVQQRLGHAHVSITLALYTHVLPGHDQAAADLLGKALDGAP